jgi:catechol 2,3-dioxygenase-like lactoylglutathione lyase family enzyme
MSVTLLYGCFQIEQVVRDLPASRAFLEAVLGAAPIEQRLAEELRGVVPEGYDIDGIDCGQATFQPNQMGPSMATRPKKSAHQRYLDAVGPCVTNLNYYVDDVFHAKELLTGLGSEICSEGPSTLVESIRDYGDNTRPGGAARPFLFLGTRHLLGFDLEIMEPNFERFVDQDVQLPAYYGERTGTGVPGLRLQRLVVVVPDIEALHANLVEIFTPGSRSNPYGSREGTEGRAFRITLGGIELEYCQPSGSEGPLAEHLAAFGPGVVTIAFGVPAVASVLDRVAADPAIQVGEAVDLLGDPQAHERWMIAGREVVGFDIVLEELDGRPLVAAS